MGFTAHNINFADWDDFGIFKFTFPTFPTGREQDSQALGTEVPTGWEQHSRPTGNSNPDRPGKTIEPAEQGEGKRPQSGRAAAFSHAASAAER